jgi:hypothetical protein
MKNISRRDFFRLGGYTSAGLALAGSGFPLLMPKRAFASTPSSSAWKFGVMADTQWRTGANSGGQPASCAVGIIDALNEQFISHDVDFVIQVGDLVDVESVSGVRSLPTRAEHAQALYSAGIGFFPVRGNHESTAVAANEIPGLFPQTLGQGAYVFGAENFQSPVMSSTGTDPLGERLKGLSYSFDYENIRCVLIDQFVRRDGTNLTGYGSGYNGNAVDQVDWVGSMLESREDDSHAFVFSHKNLIGQNHKDVLFGSSLTANSGPRDQFIASLNDNDVGYYMSGHDHMHHYSIVSSKADGSYPGRIARQFICSSNSYKFYIPQPGDDGREVPFAQELTTIGYYIVTVDGPLVWVDFYSSSMGSEYGDIDLVTPPAGYAFYWRGTSGYSLNGRQFLVARGQPYAGVEDSYFGTTARILSGVNGNTETDKLGRALSKDVNTGWTLCPSGEAGVGMASNILTLWGMADNLSLYDHVGLTGLLPDEDETEQADTFALSLSYDPKKVRPSQIVSGRFALASVDEGSGEWVNAVDRNFGGSKTFKYGPWKASYGLGTYGVDPRTSTVWAVVNRGGEFVAKQL